jgi:hypothetical protein
MAAMSLLDWILSILSDPDQRSAFQSDPDDFAGRHGFGDLSAADVHDALYLIADNQSASWDSNHQAVHYPPPHHYHNNEDAGHYLNNYITNNYRIIEDRSTDIDNSVHQRIDTDGGDFSQHIDNDTVLASGDGAVAAADDIRDSNLATGDHAVIGSGNDVAGDDSINAFGDGDATDVDFSDTHFGAGSAVNVGDGTASGSAQDDDSVTAVHAEGDTSINQVGDGSAATQITDQSDTDSGVDTHFEDNSHTTTHTDVLSHNPVHVEDVDIDAL